MHGGVVVAEGAVDILPLQIAVDQHEGQVLGRLDQVGVVLGPHLHELGTGQDDRVHPLGAQQVKILLLGVQVVAGAAEDRVVLKASEGALQIVDGVCQIGVGRVGAHDADGLHGVKAKSPGKHVGRVAQLRHHI